MLDRLHESKGLMELEVLVESDAWEVVVAVTLLTSLGGEIYSLCIGRSYLKFVEGKLWSTGITLVFTRKPVEVIWMPLMRWNIRALQIFDEEKKAKCLLFWIFSLVEKQVFNICFHSAQTQFGWILWISEGAEELSVIVLDLVSYMSSVGCRPNHIGQNTSTLPKCHIHTNRVI